MITREQMESAGYTVLENGGHIVMAPEDLPNEWEFMCEAFGVDPRCKEMVLCVCGVIAVTHEEDEE